MSSLEDRTPLFYYVGTTPIEEIGITIDDEYGNGNRISVTDALLNNMDESRRDSILRMVGHVYVSSVVGFVEKPDFQEGN